MKRNIYQGAITLMICVICFITMNAFSNFSIRDFEGHTAYQEESYIFRCNGKVIDDNYSLPDYMRFNENAEYELSTVLTYDGAKDTDPYLFMFMNHSYCRVLLDGKEIYSYTENEVNSKVKSRSPGNSYVCVPLTKDCKGKLIEVYFYPKLMDGSKYIFPKLLFGDYSTTMYKLYIGDIPLNILSSLFIIAGLVLVIKSMYKKNLYKKKEIWYLGMFSLLAGIYNLTESTFNMVIAGNPYAIYMISSFTFSISIIPLVCYYRLRANEQFSRIYSGLIGICLSVVVIQIILHSSGAAEFRDTVRMNYIMYVVVFFFAIYTMHKMDDSREKRYLIYEAIAILSGMIADVFLYAFSIGVINGSNIFLKIGLFIVLLLEMKRNVLNFREVYKGNAESMFYKEKAYTDELTGIPNKALFINEVKNFEENTDSEETVFFIAFDINNLKVINDTKGHLDGDEVIRKTAECLNSNLRNYGTVFRTGGDEFTAILYNAKEEDIKNAIKLVKHQLQEEKIFIAAGYSMYNGNDVFSGIKDADRNMYLDKWIQKKHYS